MPDSTLNLVLSGLMGIIGGMITTPINAIFSWWLKQEEQLYQHKLDVIAKERELLLKHRLEMERLAREKELASLQNVLAERILRSKSDGSRPIR